MRVLITTDSVGGVWQYSLSLARGLVEAYRCRVLLVCFGEPDQQDLADAIPLPGVDVVPLNLKLEWMPDGEADLAEARAQVARLAREWRADLLHSSQYSLGNIDLPIPRMVVAHSDMLGWIAWHRGDGTIDLDEVEDDPALRKYRDMVASGLAAADSVVCPSRFMSKFLDEFYGCPSETIYNGLWPDMYHAMPKQAVAVVAGRLWDEAKMAATAVEATRGLPIKLLLIGEHEGPSGQRASLPQSENAEYLGRLPWREAREVIAGAAYYLATSSYEPFGLSALEAAYTGCALMTNDGPSFREIWKDAAVHYHRNDPADLRARLSRLLERPDETARLGKAARSRALERYTGQKMAAQYYRLYTEM
ncbi:MAG TPA: glycosyltransferase family 4 protein [Chloroflexota bacterium]